MKQEITFTGYNDAEFSFKHDSSSSDDEEITLDIDGDSVLSLSYKEVKALSKFLSSVLE